MNPERTFLEFFAGIGLIRWALQRKGWQCVFSNDIDERKRAIYQENFGDDNFILADVNQLKAHQIPGALLATAGFPCTDLSLAGARRGLKGSESSAFWGFTKTLDHMGGRRPPLILIENVPGFLTSHSGRDFRAAVAELNRLGYRCDAFMVDASHFVPQSRVRLFIVGALSKPEVMIPLSETILYAESECRPPILTRTIDANRDLKWSLQPLPSLPVNRVTLRDVVETLPEEHPAWWSRERVDHLLTQMNPNHRARIQKRKRDPQVSVATAYRRMRNGSSTAEIRDDGIAGCLRTPRGGSSRQILIVFGGDRIRARYMTPREYARLQGVEDDFSIPGSLNQGLFGFGDAVCAPVISWINSVYLEPLIDRLRDKMTVVSAV